MLQIAPRKLARMVPDAAELDRFETASRADLAAWQREKLRETLHHAYANVPHYRAAFDQAGVHPRDFSDLPDPRPLSLHRQGGPAGELSVRDVRGAARGGGAHPRLVGHHRQADGGRLHQGRHRHTWADVVARSIRAAGGRPGMLVHVAYGYGLFTGGLGAHYGPSGSAAR